MSDVPPEIIKAILIRLPVKSLLRFRCVSKPWRSLIDGQDFIKHHLQHSAETNSNRSLLVQSAEIFYVDLDSFEPLDIGLKSLRFQPGLIESSCNGLTLILSGSDDVVLWNPSTRKQSVLPSDPPPPLPVDIFNPLCCSLERFALGYDSKHDDYKVVRVAQATHKRFGGGVWVSTQTKLYSLKTNSWKRIEDFPYPMTRGNMWGIYLNDALHGIDENNAIMAFDLSEEKHYEVPKPGVDGILVTVVAIGGCLGAVVVIEETESSEIWVMKEYGVKGSWCKLICFDPAGLCLNLFPLDYSKRRDCVLLSDNGMRLIWYNLAKKTVEVACVEGLSDLADAKELDPLFDARVCVGSLVSPYSPAAAGVGIIEKQKPNVPQGKKGKRIKKKRDDFLSSGFKLAL